MSWTQATKARLRLLLDRRGADARAEDEIRFHIDMEEARLVREQGLDPQEARRRALAAFGGVERHKEALRDGRGLAWLGGLSLDLKLGFRMLLKYPGLTVIGGLAMAFAVWCGVVVFQLVSLFLHPTLPLPDGDRLVQVRNWDVESNEQEPRALHDFLVWRRTLRSITDLGAFRDVTLNLIGADGEALPADVAEITASAFRLAPARPLLGRVLVPEDEAAGAPPVVVLGHDVWRTRFASDPRILGRMVQLGDAHATVVGVMPDGFAFPVSHDLWTPLRPDALASGPREGPGITVFGRLAPGVSFETAQAELATIGRRAAAELPATHARLQPQVRPYTTIGYEAPGGENSLLMSFNGFAILLLALVCGNVALLLFARAASREGEIVVRTALGASRGRIVAQMVAEALVLGGVATVLGLAAADLALRRWAGPFLEANLGRLPFWYDLHLSPASVLYAALLAALAALIAGVVPGLKVTRGLGTRLRQGTAGGGGVRFGGVWTAVIVAQVAATVAFPVIAFYMQREVVRIESQDPGFAAAEYLGVRLDADYASPPPPGTDSAAALEARRARFAGSLEALRERLRAEPGVQGVAFVDRLPRTFHREPRIELDDTSVVVSRPAGETADVAAPAGIEVSLAYVDPSYFEVLRAPILAGRGFREADGSPDGRVVIVDQGFVDEVLGGRNAIGRRLRFAASSYGADSSERAPWLEIVGVVKELGMGFPVHHHRAAGIYLPAALGAEPVNHMVIHARGDPLALAPRLRAIAAAVDPSMRVTSIQRLDEVASDILWMLGLWLRITAVLSGVALLLSLAGIYAVLSFAVSRRTREIGVRVALGASRGRIVAAIFRRPVTQVGVGVALGGLLVAAMTVVVTSDRTMSSGGGLQGEHVALLAAHAAFMFGVCLLACVVPAWRALRVEPTEALRVE